MAATNEETKPVLFSVEQTCNSTSLGWTTIYEEIRTGRLRTIKVGGRRLVSSSWLQDWIDELKQPASP